MPQDKGLAGEVKDALITNNPVISAGHGLAKLGKRVMEGVDTVTSTAKKYLTPATKKKSTTKGKSMSGKR
jgi:hypothetical protein